MDESLFLRAQRLLGESRARTLDHPALCAEIRARQLQTPTAQASSILPDCPAAARDDDVPLAALVLGAPDWRNAAKSQAGCFNRAAARRRVNTPATPLTRIFTVAL